MKKLLFGLFISASILGYSQKNTVKLNLNPIGLGFANNVGFTYERKIIDALSISAKFNFSSAKAAPLSGRLNDLAKELLDDANVNTDIFNNKFKSNGVSLSLKYFPKKKALTGFYLMPYFGYQSSSIDQFDFSFPDSDGNLQAGLVDAGLKFIGGGLAIGNQWIIADRLTIDITWIGIGIGISDLNILGTEKDNNDVDFQFVESSVENFKNENDQYKQFTDKINHSSSAEDILLTLRQGLPIPKILQFSIGYAF